MSKLLAHASMSQLSMPLLNVAGATDRAQEMTREGLPTLAATTTKVAFVARLEPKWQRIYIYI